MFEIFTFCFVVGVIVFGIYISFFYGKKIKKIDKKELILFRKQLKIISGENSEKQKILDSDILYHKILLSVGYIGSFGEILKQNPIVIEDIDTIWKLHKLRNKLAHELDMIESGELQKKSKEFQKEIEKLLKKLS